MIQLILFIMFILFILIILILLVFIHQLFFTFINGSLIEILPKWIHHSIIPSIFILDYPSSFTICFHNIHSLTFIPCDQSHSFISIKKLNLTYMFALPSFINWDFLEKHNFQSKPFKNYYSLASISTSTKWIYIYIPRKNHFSIIYFSIVYYNIVIWIVKLFRVC
jgi:hypothetical protein